MRMSWMPLAVMLVLILLGGTGGTTLAQEAEVPPFDAPYEVTGQAYFPRAMQNWDATWDEEREVEECKHYTAQRIELDDTRLSGWLVMTLRVDTFGGRRHGGLGEVMAASGQVVNDDGNWVGTMRGYVAEGPGRRHYWQLELTGTGAYAGHSALLRGQGGSGQRIEIQGFVFPGPLPAYPPEPEVITDPVEVVVAQGDTVAGSRVVPALRFVSSAEVGPDVFTEMREVAARKAAVDIPAGTPITSDLLEPVAE